MTNLAATTVGAAIGMAAACLACWAWLRRPANFDDHATQALTLVADDLTRRRVRDAVQRHPARGAE
jgi:hypothetical protein